MDVAIWAHQKGLFFWFDGVFGCGVFFDFSWEGRAFVIVGHDCQDAGPCLQIIL